MFGFTLYQSACLYASVTAFSATWVALALPIQHGKAGPFNYHRAIKRGARIPWRRIPAVAVSSSQDDRGFTQGEESFTHLLLVFHAQRSDIRERSTPRLFSACPSHSFSRRAVNLHAGYSSRLDACVLGVSVIAVFLARCINNNTTNTFVTRAAILPTRTHPLALFATAPPVPKPQTMAFTAAFASSCILQAGHRHTSTLAQLFPAVASSVSRSPRVSHDSDMTHSRPEHTGSPFTSSARLVVSRAVSLDDSLVLLSTFYTRTLISLFPGIAMPSHLIISQESKLTAVAKHATSVSSSWDVTMYPASDWRKAQAVVVWLAGEFVIVGLSRQGMLFSNWCRLEPERNVAERGGLLTWSGRI
ncbi:hypothetical protein Q7P35_009481 [Cladosporium inversicolor]